jgi:hypothetical protein|tara:strand:+ start:25 stop:516 length:492 start_codon:yes stop_codon:yes gene_type:complete
MNIREDLEKGKEGEDKVERLLKTIGIESEKNKDKKNLKYWDIKSKTKDSIEFKIEVKNDIMAKTTGNIAIEVGNPKSGKETGINVTKSDIWVQVIGDELWACKSKDLKNFIKKNKAFKTIKYAGDGNATILLYKMQEILPAIFIPISELSQKHLADTIHKLII